MDYVRKLVLRLRSPERRSQLGYAYAFLSALGGVVAAAFCQALHGAVPGYELAAVRFCHLSVIVIPRAVFLKVDVRMDLEKVGWIVLISGFVVLWNIFFYTAAVYIPLGTLMTSYTSLTYLEMIVLARVFLGQKFVWGHLALAVLAPVGNLLLVQPDPPIPRPEHPCNVTMYDSALLRPPLALTDYVPMLIATLLASTSGIIYKLKLRDVPLEVASVWITVCGLFTTTGLTVYLVPPVLVNGWVSVALLTGHGTGAAVHTLFLQHAQKVLTPDQIFAVDVKRCLLGFLLQYAVWEFASGFVNVLEYIGAACGVLGVLVSGVWVARRSTYVWYKKEQPLLLPGDYDFIDLE